MGRTLSRSFCLSLIFDGISARVHFVICFLHVELCEIFMSVLGSFIKRTACARPLSQDIKVCLCFIHCEPRMYFYTAESFPASSQVGLSRQTAG